MRISDWSSDVCSSDLGERWRPSANAAVQWKPTPDLEIYADGLFQGFRSKVYNRWMFIPIFGDIKLSNVTTLTGTNHIDTTTVTGAVPPAASTGSFHAKRSDERRGGK